MRNYDFKILTILPAIHQPGGAASILIFFKKTDNILVDIFNASSRTLEDIDGFILMRI
jgi:hypothetical protein